MNFYSPKKRKILLKFKMIYSTNIVIVFNRLEMMCLIIRPKFTIIQNMGSLLDMEIIITTLIIQVNKKMVPEEFPHFCADPMIFDRF